jgi:hypothetical protein
VVFLLPLGVFAIGNPEGGVSIGDAYVFRNVVETGDQLYFVRYDVSYDPVPSEDPEDTWQMALYDVSGNLVATRPLNYYQHNIISIYLTSLQAITWGAEHQVKIMGMPSVFGNLTEGVNMRTRTLAGGDYKEKDFLAGIMIAQAKILETDWGITLLTADDKLNSTGKTFFLAAVHGLGTMVPEIFEVVVGGVDITYKDYNQTYAESLEANAGTRFSTAISDISNLIRVPSTWMGFWLFLIVFLMIAGIIFVGEGNPGWGFIGGFSVLALGGFLLGGNMFSLVMILVTVVGIIFALYFILSRFA